MHFDNDPFAIIFEAFDVLYPGMTFSCGWAEELHDEEGNSVYGETFFPDDGSSPVVTISASLTVKDAVEVLAHEMAHVAAGEGAGHGTAWETAFQAIYDQYITILENMDAGA